MSEKILASAPQRPRSIRRSGTTNEAVIQKFTELYRELFAHDGYGDIRVEMKLLRAGQKEVIIHCGKQHRFLVDFDEARRPSHQALSKKNGVA